MFGLGFWEILIILTIALLVIGPKQLPDVAKKLGRTFAQFRHTTEEFRREMTLPPVDFEQQMSKSFDTCESEKEECNNDETKENPSS